MNRTDATLVMGSVTGVRTFEVNYIKGTLHPPSYEMSKHFVDGVNYATCPRMHGGLWHTYDYGTEPENKLISEGGYNELRYSALVGDWYVDFSATHPVASLHCSCGFYAFRTWEQSARSHYPSSTTVQAIVEGFGHVTVGSEGFRAEKIKIKALVVPQRTKVQRMAQRYLASRWSLWLLIVAMFVLVINLFSYFLDAYSAVSEDEFVQAWISTSVVGIASIPMALSFAARHLQGNRSMKEELNIVYLERCLDKVRRRYPNVEIFHSHKAALRAHPVSDFKSLTKERA